MTEVQRILDQLGRAMRGPAWHGPSVMEALEGVTAAQAAARPVAGAHTIFELVGHIAVWKAMALDRMSGGRRQLSEAENFPPAPSADEAAWQAALAGLQRDHEALCAFTQRLADADLERGMPQVPELSHYVLVHGVVQHDLYHAGQIVLLRRAL